jgi:NADH-quinone oxidoreductase subunit D
MEDYCGARLIYSAVRIGGVSLDLPKNWIADLENFMAVLESQIPIYEGLLTENRIWRMRLEDVGVIPVSMAKSWALSGIALRGSGVKWDLRKEMPYGLYPELDFDIPISDKCDSYGRYKCYMAEMYESMKILRQLIPMYRDSDTQIMAHSPQYISSTKEEMMTQNYSLMQHFVLVTQGMRPPVGEVYVATESPKGELGFMVVSDGTPYPYKLKCRAPSFWHTGILQDLLPGHQLADVVTIIGNLNIVFGEIDR